MFRGSRYLQRNILPLLVSPRRSGGLQETLTRYHKAHISTATSEIAPTPPLGSFINDTTNEEITRKVFDDDAFWKSFNDVNSKSTSSSFFNYKSNSVGLFQNPYLKRPSGLKEFSAESLDKAQKLTKALIEDDSETGLRNYIRNLDRLSDILCRVIDLCEFIRVVHPNKSFVNAAQECHQDMFQHMNVLNTSKELYDKLERVLNDPQISKDLTKEEIAVGTLLHSDFKKSGIDMDESTQNNFVELSQYIAITGQHFSNGVADNAEDYILIDKDLIREGDISKTFQKSLTYDRKGNVRIPLYGRIPFELLRSCPNKYIREKIWLTLHNVPGSQIQYLDNFLKYRGVLARLMGNQSFSEYQLHEKMAKTPENVISFLKNLQNEIYSDVLEELRILYKYQPDKTIENPTDDELVQLVKPWDREYLSTLHLMKQKSHNLEDISSYFSVGTVVAGLSSLFKSIYGIELKPVKTETGETWSDDVRKFEVVSETEGIVGIIYLDLFYRDNKTLNPAHFTVCCSRKIYPEELDSEDEFNLKLKTIQTNEYKNEIFQLPIISLVCNFVPDYYKNGASKSLLTLSHVETLFHEMGHAMHSMLGRTNLHNVSGTRCSTDFVELPSILMEHFAKDERVLMSFAKHHETGKPLPLNLIRRHQIDNSFFNKSEVFGQIKMALLDQVLHSDVVFARDFDPVKIYHELEKNMKVFNDPISNWPGKFGHLFSYGSVYYSYLFDRAIAAKIWRHLFADDPLDRKGGEKFKNQVLKWGGSRDPWVLLSEVFDKPELKKGDQKAMEFIGKATDI
ncbi:hypothetical protein CANARDRAFT_10479 [[Candida] arabinofermentans NRRL YB-2248]|uniref:Mitochondrial intermediate peptidase n=1 Tax=[Candida] arabinofermentans NRRL YB-2248 TaxID=983967 RepID=A0A1E4SSN4_9ASCO|nr:hypothetical protein CANARDRAFT_10479 [[Candida] arabinofermentans NRRL YB-2248]